MVGLILRFVTIFILGGVYWKKILKINMRAGKEDSSSYGVESWQSIYGFEAPESSR